MRGEKKEKKAFPPALLSASLGGGHRCWPPLTPVPASPVPWVGEHPVPPSGPGRPVLTALSSPPLPALPRATTGCFCTGSGAISSFKLQHITHVTAEATGKERRGASDELSPHPPAQRRGRAPGPAALRAPAHTHTRTRSAHTRGLTHTNTPTLAPYTATLCSTPLRRTRRRLLPARGCSAGGRQRAHATPVRVGAPWGHANTRTSPAAVPESPPRLPRDGSSGVVVTHTRTRTVLHSAPSACTALPSIPRAQRRRRVRAQLPARPCTRPTREVWVLPLTNTRLEGPALPTEK